MSQSVEELLKAALELTPVERGELADRLWETLDPPASDVDGMTDEELASELDRRHEEFLRDPSVGVPWEEVRRKLMSE